MNRTPCGHCGHCGERETGSFFRVGACGRYRNAYVPLCDDCLESFVVAEFNRDREPAERRDLIRRVAHLLMPAVIERFFRT